MMMTKLRGGVESTVVEGTSVFLVMMMVKFNREGDDRILVELNKEDDDDYQASRRRMMMMTKLQQGGGESYVVHDTTVVMFW